MNIADLATRPLADEQEIGMVEIIVLKWKRPDVETRCARQIIENTEWPYKLVIYDNRMNPPNTAKIWNKLIRQATCDYICLIDSDAFVPRTNPCWLTRMMETFSRLNCRLVLPITNNCSTPAQKVPEEPYPAADLHHGEWSGFCFLFHRSLLYQVGPFDEEFVGYGQDSEFSVRLERKTGGAYIRRDVFVEHIQGASFKTDPAYATADREHAQKLYLEKIAR